MTAYLLSASLLLSSTPPMADDTCRSAPTRLVAVNTDGVATGVKLLEVPSGSFWDRLRLKSGDVLLRINGQAIHKPELVCARLHSGSIPAELDISRRGSSWHIRVRLGERPGHHERVLELCGTSRLVSASIDDATHGVKLLKSNAALTRMGLSTGDVVLRVGDQTTATAEALCFALAAADDATSVELSRRGRRHTQSLNGGAD